jgi:transposase
LGCLTPEFFITTPVDRLIRAGLQAEDLHDDSLGRALDRLDAVVSLIGTYRSAIPVWLEVLSGRSADKTTFPQTVRAYVAQLQAAERPCFIADSATALKRKGKFILATNVADAEQLPAETMLAAYKAQSFSGERGFRFLKDPLFFADSLFLKRPERLMALLMAMGVALLVYALAEHGTDGVGAAGECLPAQLGQPTRQPTMRRIFQLVEGIDVLWLWQPLGVQRLVLNLQPIHR